MKYVRKLVDNYCVLDLETTGLSFDFCEIIEIGILKIRNNKVVDKYSQLVKPIEPIDEFITELTGITQEMLDDKPTLKEIKKQIISFIGDDLIVGHNTYFDKNFLEIGLNEELQNEYTDTLQFSRKIYPELSHHRLKDLVEYLNLSSNDHRALSDCITTKELYDYIKHYMKENDIEIKDIFYQKKKISIDDIKQTSENIDEGNFFFGKHCVFTGTLEKISRKEAMQIVVNVGGILDKSVTKSTNYLILGNNDFCKSVKDGKSKKQKRAEQLKLQGNDIEIIDENTFYSLLENDINKFLNEKNILSKEKETNNENIVKLDKSKKSNVLNEDEIKCLKIVKEILIQNSKDPTPLRGLLQSSGILSISLFGELFKIKTKGKLKYIILNYEYNINDIFKLDSKNRLIYENINDIYKLENYIVKFYDIIIKQNEDYIKNVKCGQKNYKHYLETGIEI